MVLCRRIGGRRVYDKLELACRLEQVCRLELVYKLGLVCRLGLACMLGLVCMFGVNHVEQRGYSHHVHVRALQWHDFLRQPWQRRREQQKQQRSAS